MKSKLLRVFLIYVRELIIFTEVKLVEAYKDQPLINDVIQYLKENRFSIYNMYGINENPLHQATITNLLFLSPSFRTELVNSKYGRYFDI